MGETNENNRETCRPVVVRKQLSLELVIACDFCGYPLGVQNDLPAGLYYPFKYCPGCGRKIMEGRADE